LISVHQRTSLSPTRQWMNRAGIIGFDPVLRWPRWTSHSWCWSQITARLLSTSLCFYMSLSFVTLSNVCSPISSSWLCTCSSGKQTLRSPDKHPTPSAPFPHLQCVSVGRQCTTACLFESPFLFIFHLKTCRMNADWCGQPRSEGEKVESGMLLEKTAGLTWERILFTSSMGSWRWFYYNQSASVASCGLELSEWDGGAEQAQEVLHQGMVWSPW
jgi:hypothetical protein